MKVIVLRKALVEVMKKVGNFVQAKNFIPMLANVKLQTTIDGKLMVIGGNADTMVEIEMDVVEIEEIGSVLIPFKKLNDFIKKAKYDLITIEEMVEDVNIKCYNIDYKLVKDDVYNYPTLPNENWENYITMGVNDYERMINNTTFAVAKTESRPTLQGVNIRKHGNELQFVGTDSYRLGLFKYDVSDKQIDNNIDVTLNGKDLEKTVKLLNKDTDKVMVITGYHTTLVKFDNVTIYMKNIEGNYPNIERLLNLEFETYATLNTKEMMESLDMIMTIVDDKNNSVKLELNDTMVLKNVVEENGKMSATLDGAKTGNDLTIGFNAKYVSEALKALNEKDVNINFTTNIRPFTIEAHDGKVVHLILPIRLF